MRSYLYEWQRRTFWFSFSHTHWSVSDVSMRNINTTNNINEGVSPFNLSKTILVSYTHRNVKVFTATHQNKSFLLRPSAEIFVQQNVHTTTTTTKIMKTLFLRNDHTTFLTWFNFNCKFLLFANFFLIFNNFKINEIDVLCFLWEPDTQHRLSEGKINHLIWLF